VDDRLDVIFDVCEPLVVAPAADASAEEIASIDVALDQWNRLGESRLTRDETAGAARLPIEFEPAASAFHGLYDDEVGVVFVNRNLTDPHQRAITISHELGHAFGLWHDDARPSVMNPGNLSIEPNAGDRDALTALWGDCP
jgi:Zn-dependent peptidase ImmA (M78 family)